jgi:hypothetical protein
MGGLDKNGKRAVYTRVFSRRRHSHSTYSHFPGIHFCNSRSTSTTSAVVSHIMESHVDTRLSMPYAARTSACWHREGDTEMGFLEKLIGGKKGSTVKKAVATPALKKAAPKKVSVAKKSVSASKKSSGKKK